MWIAEFKYQIKTLCNECNLISNYYEILKSTKSENALDNVEIFIRLIYQKRKQ